MRITNSYIYDTFRSYLQKSAKELVKSQVTMGTQKSINRVSDDPVSAGLVQDSLTRLSRTNQFVRNIDRVSSQANFTDAALGQVEDMLMRAKELMLSQASTATATASTREAVAIELTSLRSQLLAVANSRVGNRYLFAGTNDGVIPFPPTAVTIANGVPNSGNAAGAADVADEASLTGDTYEIEFTAPGLYDIRNVTKGTTVAANQTYVSGGDILFEGILAKIANNPNPPAAGDVFTITTVLPGGYDGNSKEFRVEVESGEYVPVNLPGDRVFQGVGLVNGENLFTVLNEAINALRANDTATIDASLDRLDASLGQISEQRSVLGARENLFDLTQNRLTRLSVDLDTLRSQLEDADLVDTVTDFNQRDTAYKALLGVTARIAQVSLLDFLK